MSVCSSELLCRIGHSLYFTIMFLSFSEKTSFLKAAEVLTESVLTLEGSECSLYTAFTERHCMGML